MGLIERRIAATLAVCLLTCAAAPQHAPTPRKLPPIDVSIAIAVNGELLSVDPAPRIVGAGRLVVPVVRIYSALGIAVSRSGNAITASAPGKRIVLHIGSAVATIDDRPVTMETPAMTIDGATYVPLRFVAESLGAQATFNPGANRVEVVSSLVGRNPALEQQSGDGASQLVGNVSAVDLNSAPQSLSIVRGATVRTVAITSGAKVDLQDVVARTSTPGTLPDVHVGDAVSVIVLPDGHVGSVIVRYASRNGTIAAVSATQFVLNTGFIVSPDATTAISLNGEPATFADLAVGDAVVVRLNPDTNEKRQILVSRVIAAASPAPDGAAAIESFAIDAAHPLRAGDSFNVTLRGTPGGRATFDIGVYLTGLPLAEQQPGVYGTRYVIPANVNFGPTTVYGHLAAGGAAAPRSVASSLLAVSNTPPQITDIAPLSGQNVNNDRPSIYATFRAPTGVGVNPSSVSISVNGTDVTAAATRTDQFITYSPSVPLADGPVSVAVRVSDQAGNQQTRTWSFTIHAR
jgi:hypothetical protein